MNPNEGGIDTFSPSMVANLFAPNSSLGEQIMSAYMPSWALLGMTAVEVKG
jgi:hypothetical protein